MKSEKEKQLETKGSLWLRIPGFLIGLVSIVLFPVLSWQDQASVLSAFSGVFIGALFVAYGLGGPKLLFKVFPSTYVRKL